MSMMEFNLGFENGVVIKELLKTERSEELLEFLGKLPTKNDLLLMYKSQVVFSCMVYDYVSERRLLDYLKIFYIDTTSEKSSSETDFHSPESVAATNRVLEPTVLGTPSVRV
jgi:hypothetical protein